jgi:hypothetical protein
VRLEVVDRAVPPLDVAVDRDVGDPVEQRSAPET